MQINNYFLDFGHTIGGGGSNVHFLNVLSLNPNPNSLIYFFGLLIAMLTQILVVYDYVSNFVLCSPYLVFSKDADMRYLIEKFSLSIVNSSFIDKVFWPISLSIFFLEVILCFIFFTFFHISLLWLSIVIWTISVLSSLFSLIFINKYIKDLDDIKRVVRLRDAEKTKLEVKIAQLIPLWRIEEMNIHGENFTESLLEKRIDEYRTIYSSAIDEFLTIENLFIVEEQEDAGLELFEGTVWEWLEAPTHYNAINLLMYSYYVILCCNDSVYLYNAIYPNLFSVPRTDALEKFDSFSPETSNIINWFIHDYIYFFSFYF
jgi:hypothetical protein